MRSNESPPDPSLIPVLAGMMTSCSSLTLARPSDKGWRCSCIVFDRLSSASIAVSWAQRDRLCGSLLSLSMGNPPSPCSDGSPHCAAIRFCLRRAATVLFPLLPWEWSGAMHPAPGLSAMDSVHPVCMMPGGWDPAEFDSMVPVVAEAILESSPWCEPPSIVHFEAFDQADAAMRRSEICRGMVLADESSGHMELELPSAPASPRGEAPSI